jgi:hypothetical protein
VPAHPVLGFSPQGGAPGTTVKLWGSGYTPNTHVAIRLGQPAPLGEVLVSAATDAAGKWSAELVMPDRLPSGDPITGDKLRLVAMDEQNTPLASAPFALVVAGPTHAAATQSVVDLLGNFGSGEVTPYVAKTVRDQMAAGRPLHQIIGLAPIAPISFQAHAPQDRPSEVLFVPATLYFPTFIEERVFELVVEDQSWKVQHSSLAETRPVEADTQPTPVGWPGPEWQIMATSDYNGDSVPETIYEMPGMLATKVTFDDAETQAHAYVAEQVLLAQQAVPGPRVLLEIDRQGIRAGGAELMNYAGTDLAGYLVSLTPGARSLVNIIPLNPDGTAMGLPLGIGWDVEADGYRIVSYETH